MRYIVYGIYTYYTPNLNTGHADETETVDALATFDTLELAKSYIENNKLKKPKRESWRSDRHFKSNSLLGNYTYADIEEEIPLDLPHNPE